VGGAVKPEEFDYFHELIIHQELARSGYRTFQDAYWVGAVIGLPPVLNFGRPEIQHIVPDIFAGKKFISLAISEAFAGSDVAGIRCTAKLTDDKKFWIVNGSKKWITNGHFSDYFSVCTLSLGQRDALD
jgi:alkylation response protein AidB-like acyl-CoA dehydrogenase